MIGRNKRGNRGISVRARLAVAAAVLVGGGAAGVVAVAATHGGATAAQSTGYYTNYQRGLSESHAMSDAMDWWSKSPQTSFNLISRMQTIRTVSMTAFHTHMLVVQRGTVAASAPGEFVTRSQNNQLEVWHTTRGTQFFNVGGNQTGWNAMSGGTMSSYGNWNWSNTSSSRWNMNVRNVARDDLVFVFGERVDGKLIAQLVLFAAPLEPAAAMTPTSTPTTPTMTATPPATAAPNTTTNQPAANNGMTFSNSHS